MLSLDGKEIFVEFEKLDNTHPVLVLSHPITASIELEDRLQFPDWRICAQSQSLLRYDYPGHGKSRTEHDYRNLQWEKLAEDLCSLLNFLKVTDVVLAGSSMGAGVSLHASLLSGKSGIKVHGLVLAIPPIFGVERKKLSPVYTEWAKVLTVGGADALVEKWRMAPPTAFFQREFPEARELCFADLCKRDPLSMAAAFKAAALSDLPPASILNTITCPVQILARVEDPLHPVAAAKKLAGHLANARLSVANDRADVEQWPLEVCDFSKML